MTDGDLAALTAEVMRSFADTPSDRLRVVLQSLVRHLHAFIGEVGVTEAEWRAAVDFLTRTGQRCDAGRQEFVLLSDVLGASMAMVAMNSPRIEAALAPTQATVLGPFFVEGAPLVPLGGDLSGGVAGRPCHVSGTVRDIAGRPVPGARLEVWESDEDGFYDVQYGDRIANRGHLFTDAEGGYRFWATKPAPYPIPHDGPVGELLAASARGPMRPAHLHFMVSAPGMHTLTTHIFVDGDDYLGADAVFGVKESLVVPFTEQPPGPAPDGRHMNVAWWRARFDIALTPVGARTTGVRRSSPPSPSS